MAKSANFVFLCLLAFAACGTNGNYGNDASDLPADIPSGDGVSVWDDGVSSETWSDVAGTDLNKDGIQQIDTGDVLLSVDVSGADGGDLSGAQCTDAELCTRCPDGYNTCREFLDCATGCIGSYEVDLCVDECGRHLSYSGSSALYDLEACMIDNGCRIEQKEWSDATCDVDLFFCGFRGEVGGCFGTACSREKCRGEYLYCFSGCGIESCSLLESCFLQCQVDNPMTETDEYENCIWSNCWMNACPPVQEQYTDTH